jgi:threonyl-tRNA synthetase
MPEQFKLEYITESGKPAQPAMIHRAMLGSLERFLGVYIEHCAGAFPTWLAPVQAIVIGISEHQTPYVNQIAEQLTKTGYRIETDIRNEKVGYKIREAETMKVPFMAVVGAREMESGGVSVRRHGQGDLGSMTVDELIQSIETDIKQGMSTN